jgi:hypothetical protein
MGMVHLKGLIADRLPADCNGYQNLVFTLPNGLRPRAREVFPRRSRTTNSRA